MRQYPMRVKLRLFGQLKEIAGAAEQWRDVREGDSVADLLAAVRLEGALPVLILDVCAVAVNQEYVGRVSLLRDGDEVALLPPVSGGAA